MVDREVVAEVIEGTTVAVAEEVVERRQIFPPVPPSIPTVF